MDWFLAGLFGTFGFVAAAVLVVLGVVVLVFSAVMAWAAVMAIPRRNQRIAQRNAAELDEVEHRWQQHELECRLVVARARSRMRAPVFQPMALHSWMRPGHDYERDFATNQWYEDGKVMVPQPRS